MSDLDSDIHSPEPSPLDGDVRPYGEKRGIWGFFEKRKRQILIFIVGIVSLSILILCIGAFIIYVFKSSTEKQCLPRPLNPIEKEDLGQDQLPLRFKGSLLLKNVNILTGYKDEDKSVIKSTDILVKDGIIAHIGKSIPTTNVDKVYNFVGHIVSPGIIDAHSHIGVYALPELDARQDGNEMTNPVFPQARAIDALFPSDPAIHDSLRGGVTTAQILPGSGNNIGGEAVMIKLRGNSVDELRIKNAPRSLKMACGENPKRYYGGRHSVTPMSRMGSAWVMREILDRARKLKFEQDAWDCNPENANEDSWKRPSDLSLDPLVSLLRHEAVLNTHCYEVEDFEMMIRLSKEFDFKIATFHHGLSAYKIPNQLKENDITVATFADLFGYKVEAYDASVLSPKILDEAGVNVAMKSDHPVTHSKDLISQAARAFYYGFKEESAIASLTSVPAKAIRMDKRIGKVEVGLEADLVVWDRHPLELGARPIKVFIEGSEVFTSDRLLRDTNTKLTTSKNPSITYTGECKNNGYTEFTSYAVKNAKVYTMDDSDTILENRMIVVVNGVITCIDTETVCSPQLPPLSPEFIVKDGDTIVTPGLIEASTSLGLIEIEAEDSTGDGSSYGSVNDQLKVQAMNGIRLQSRAMQAAWAGGVVTSITPPISSTMFEGLSVAYNTAGDFLENSLINSTVALHISIGNDAKVKNTITASISGQFSQLESQFNNAITNPSNDNLFYQVLNGYLPLAVRAYDADVIHNLIRLKKKYGFKLIIIGAAEAHLLAKELKENNVNVIITPNQEGYIATQQYQTLRSDDFFGAETLYQAGVNFGFGMGSLYNARNLRWQGGLIADSGVIPQQTAIKMMTRTIADMFEIGGGVGRVQVGTKANFVVFSGNPLTYDGRIMISASGNKVSCVPQQFK